MKKMLLSLLVLLLVVSVGLYAFAPHVPATPKQVTNKAELETYLNKLVASGNPPGLSVVVVQDDKVVYSNAFGYADGPQGIKATPETVYHWWSMTKIPTAVAVMRLHEQGKLNMDDLVTKYLPWFEVNYPSAASNPLTIRHLLQHSSGLPDTVPAMIGWVHYDDVTPDQTEVVKKYLPEFNTLQFEPGTQAVYSNLNYMVLGAVIEAASGQTYESYIEENILQPLGMSQTSFVYSPSMVEHAAAGSQPVVHFYTPLLPTMLDPNKLVRERDGKSLWMNRFYIEATPSTGLIGPASDAARFMLMYLNAGTLDGTQILHPESIAMLTGTAPIDQRGLGWYMNVSADGERYIDHAGGGAGFATIMRIYPDRDLGIAILANSTDLDRDGLVELLKSLGW
jgi:CubicO group peptidase (beta-lactamase class C family)